MQDLIKKKERKETKERKRKKKNQKKKVFKYIFHNINFYTSNIIFFNSV
jgi:hypothetical protein